MPTEQSAICKDGEIAGVFITLTIGAAADARARIRRAMAGLQELTREVGVAVAEPNLVSAVGVGSEAWPRLFETPPPPGLAPFPAMSDGPRRAPATPADIFIHIHGRRPDACFQLARRVMAQLGDAVRLVEEVQAFRTLGNRDLTGFVDGTENPKGAEMAEVALVPGDDPSFAGGSYVSIQRWVHDLAAWETLPVREQEGVIGRTKADDREMDDEVKPPFAHIARVVIEDEEGEELAVLRHSLPYGTTGEHGLYFVAYGATPDNFRLMLERMVKADTGGHHDRLMDYTRPVTGASFFCPNLEFLADLT